MNKTNSCTVLHVHSIIATFRQTAVTWEVKSPPVTRNIIYFYKIQILIGEKETHKKNSGHNTGMEERRRNSYTRQKVVLRKKTASVWTGWSTESRGWLLGA
jgi:hypothetical protein